MYFCISHWSFFIYDKTPIYKMDHATEKIFFLYFIKYTEYKKMFQVKFFDINDLSKC